MYRYALSILILTLATGCAGDNRQPTVAPLNEETALPTYDRIVANTNLELHGTVVGYRRRGNKLYLVSGPGACAGEACPRNYTLEDTSLQILGVERGVSRVNESFQDAEQRIWVYGGWMEDSFFAIQGNQFLSPRGGTHRGLYGLTMLHGYAVGYAPGTNPGLGGMVARWNGLMMGVDVGAWPNRGDALFGDATIVVELTDTGMQADVSFTNIADQFDVPRPDMAWEALDVEAGRFAHENGVADNLGGAFFGADHGEVAGTFLRDLVTGVFGGVRE